LGLNGQSVKNFVKKKKPFWKKREEKKGTGRRKPSVHIGSLFHAKSVLGVKRDEVGARNPCHVDDEPEEFWDVERAVAEAIQRIVVVR